MRKSIKFYFSLLVFLLFYSYDSYIFASSNWRQICQESQCYAIIDAGSSGSRFYIYSKDYQVLYSHKIYPGLSTIAKSQIPQYLSQLVPEVHALSIPTYFYGTAGMRLLPEEEQSLRYQSVSQWFSSNPTWDLRDIRTILGKEEGVFAWLAAHRHHEEKKAVLEVGGASYQVNIPVDEAYAQTLPPENISVLNLDGEKVFVWSKTTWAFVDREFLMFAQEKLLLKSPADGAKLFSLFWESYEKRALYLFRDYSAEFLNDDGFAIIWDMVNYLDVWKKLFLIDPNYLEEPYLGHFNQIKQFKNHVNPDDSTSIISLKYRFYRMYRDTNNFTKICALIDELKDELTAGLKFKSEVQTNLLNGLGIRNITTLYLNNKPVHEMNLHRILPQLVEMKLEKQWGKKVSQTLPKELTNQFKSIPQGSAFSKAFLERSLEEIHSKHDQLDFLEKCYGNIVKSEQYVRRNKRLDEMFSFFRNDLTTSQRVHIQILKEKYQEIFASYSKEILDGEWLSLHRGSELIECNTNRFCLNIKPLFGA
jgi:hypothetical protein